MNPGKVFYAVLNMGLGHATRSLPIIKEFINKNWQLLIGSNGRSLEFLKKELPTTKFIVTPDYGISYSQSNFLFFKLIPQISRIFRKIREEKQLCDKIVAEFSPDLVISDHCYGMYHSNIQNYFLSHQIYFAIPQPFQFLSPLISRFNHSFHRKYHKVIIPDLPENGNGLLSGRLSNTPSVQGKYYYAGILSSIRKQVPNEQVDLLVSISGPEPQRTIFEKIILKQINRISGKKIVVLGKSEKDEIIVYEDDLKVYSHLPRCDMEKLFNQAELIITRPGYSTLMELSELGKIALLVPTPGQTEQQYLANRMAEKGWFYFVDQKHLNLVRDIEIAKTYGGLFKPDSTQMTIDYLFKNIFKV